MPNPLLRRRLAGGRQLVFDYYVTKAGNDSTGDGSIGKPWLTLSKAFSVATAGKSIGVGDGVYQENTSSTGYWSISLSLADWLTVMPIKGAAGNVTVEASSGTLHNTLIAGTSSHLRFKYITFGVLAGTRYCFRFNVGANNIDFQFCTFSHTTNYALVHAETGTASLTNITFENCTFTSTGTYAGVSIQQTGAGTCSFVFTNCTHTASGGNTLWLGSVGSVTMNGCSHTLTGSTSPCIFITALAGTLTLVNTTVNCAAGGGGGYAIRGDIAGCTVNLTNVTVNQTGASDGVNLNGGTITISGGTFTQTNNYKCLCLGVDGTSGNATTISVSGLTCNKAGGTIHAVAIGAGCTGTVTNLTVPTPTGDYGLVIKENANVSLTYSHIDSGTAAALYLKGATSPVVTNNTLNGISGGVALQMAVGDTGDKTSGANIQNNNLTAAGTSNLFNWQTTGDNGSNVCDYNTYAISGGGNYGTVRASSGITTIAGLRAAWSGYTNPNNDANSTGP
jgi:hypothetical protein